MTQNKVKLLILSGLFAALTAIGAFLKIPFYPVPFTLQTLFTVLSGLVLPPRWAASSQIVYLVVGLLGLPVFANGGGLGYVLQPTFGYLIFLPLSAYIISKFVSAHRNVSIAYMIFLASSGSLVVLVGGAVWLYINLKFIVEREVSLWAIFYSGLLIFIPAMILKSVLATLIWKAWKKHQG